MDPSAKADHRTVLKEHALKREECTTGTRIQILEDITKWADDFSHRSPCVFWLTGQAGSGKTTIAYTVARRFEQGPNADAHQHTILGGNFLCSRQFAETRDPHRILPTIAYHLARKCKSYADALHVADKFDSINYDVATQLKDLLAGPWLQSEGARRPDQPPYLIVIDALDEIEGDGGSSFLRDLLTVINEYDLRGVKFLVTSRSDPEIAALCKSFASEAVCRLQDVPIEEADSDIRTYLNIKLPNLANSSELSMLSERTGGLFIYAATAVKYLTPHRSTTGREQTEMLEDLLANSYDLSATFLVDELYRRIMFDTFSKYKGRFLVHRLSILYTFLCTAERTSSPVVAALVDDIDDKIIRSVIDDLHAVLYIQDDHVYWYHASFPDFIFNPMRSNFQLGEEYFEFSCNKPAHHSLLSQSCFRIMESGLRFNMGNIPSSYLFDSDNPIMLSKQVKQNIDAVLTYSCRYWADHLPSVPKINTNILCRSILDFLQIRVLFWIEAMNLLAWRSHCTPMLQRTRQWVLEVCILWFELYCNN